MLEARRRFRLLDLLKNRARTEWTAEMAREVEALSAEAYIAQWGRQRK